jgi:hypothetical protein
MASHRSTLTLLLGSFTVAVASGGACSATTTRSGFTETSGTTGGSGTSSGTGNSLGTGGVAPTGTSNGGSTGALMIDAGGGTGGGQTTGGDPTTCAEAAASKTYIGCDFWPTVTANNVWSIFDFAAVVANAGTSPATVTVTGPNNVNQTQTVAPNSLQTFYLPWVSQLKGLDGDSCGTLMPFSATVEQAAGAYHLVSSTPVTVYQFSALEYQGMGGPSGKNWGSCPGNSECLQDEAAIGCYSFTNDASLLLPSTAMTGNYRVTGIQGWPDAMAGATFTITGTQANTSVKVYVAPNGHVLAGNQIPDTPGGGVITIPNLGAGDVVEFAGDPSADNTGSLIQASKPVQVIAGHPCTYVPQNTADPACDHLEQSVFPAETLGKHYFVAPPTSPHNNAATAAHVVRFVGNAAGTTTLKYPSGATPPGAPLTLVAGQVVDMGVVSEPFEVTGNNEFAIVTFMLGGSQSDPEDQSPSQLGDPSQSNAIAVEQYRVKYVFLAPTDYTESYVDITMPMTGAGVVLDGAALSVNPTQIGTSTYGIARVALTNGNNGAHILTSTLGVGIQVIGYGAYTSYQYPGGLNLNAIAPPPPPPQ